MVLTVASRRSKQSSVEDEVAQLRGLHLKGLHARWKIAFRKVAPSHLPRHLLFGVLAYQLQADKFGDLDTSTKRAIEQGSVIRSRKEAAKRLEVLDRQQATAEAGTVLVREWKGRKHRVMAMTEGFTWNGKTFKSLSGVAFAMTGTRWNGPRFFGLRGSSGGSKEAQ